MIVTSILCASCGTTTVRLRNSKSLNLHYIVIGCFSLIWFPVPIFSSHGKFCIWYSFGFAVLKGLFWHSFIIGFHITDHNFSKYVASPPYSLPNIPRINRFIQKTDGIRIDADQIKPPTHYLSATNYYNIYQHYELNSLHPTQ